MAINVSDNNPRINYTATSGQTVFTVPFEFFASTDLTVYVDGSVLSASAYTVTGGSGSTGSITTDSGQTAGAEIAIVRDVPLERTTDLTASYSASSLNDQLDRLVTQVADLDDRVSRSISLNDYEVGVSLDLPAKASRLGKTIQFHSTTGALEVGPSGDELTSIASIASDITSLNGIKTNVTTVAGAISNVNSVGSNISSVTSVASSISNVNTVNTNIANVNSLAGSISDINDVADSLDQVELVGGSISNVDIVGAAISNVNTVAGDVSNINTVAGISGNVATVAGITSAISTVNSNATNINLVATNIDDVNDVANVITKVTTVADNIVNVNTVAPSVGYLSTIANNIANINTLAPISADITTVAGVASSVGSAAANAAAAEAAKIAAQAAQAAAELAADNFDDTYLGAKASDPTLDNDGDSLGDGDLYFNTTNNILKVYSDSAWQAAALDASGLVNVTGSTMTGNLLFGDGNEARFGTHGDLTIEHDLNNSNIIASNNKPLNITANGGFNINSDNIYFREHAASNTYMEMRDGGGYDHAVRIFHSGTDVRLETTSTGIDVTGTVTATGTSVFASLDISGDIDVDGTTNLDATNIVGALDVTGTITSDGLTVDTNTLHVDATNNRVGIGTILPSAQFTSYKSLNGDPQLGHFYNDNSGAAAEAVIYITNSSTLADGLFLQTYGANGTTAGGFVQDASIIGSGTGASGGLSIMTRANADMRFYTNGHTNERMRIDSSGNVGIGTSSPQDTGVGYSNLTINGTTGGVIDLTDDDVRVGSFFNTANDVSLGNFTATGFLGFRTNSTERMRIDSSGNLLVGHTAESTWDANNSAILRASGVATFTSTATPPLYANRLTSDGDIAVFRKDGSTVGSIGVDNTDNLTISGNSGHCGLNFSTDDVNPYKNGAYTNGTTNLGSNTTRFKDLYLSGGVYLGGTGADNKLDDYETGTWTPTPTYGTVSYLQNNYTKIGRLVTVSAFIYNISDQSTSALFTLGGLPFTSSSNSRTTGSLMMRYSDNTSISAPYITATATTVEFYSVTSGGWDALLYNDFNNSGAEIYFTVSYLV